MKQVIPSDRPFREPARSTTILSVRHNGRVAIGGDGQVTYGSNVLKHDTRKLRKLLGDQVAELPVGMDQTVDAGDRPPRVPPGAWAPRRFLRQIEAGEEERPFLGHG